MSLHYLVKRSIRVLQENGNETSFVHSYAFEVLLCTLAMLWFKKINSNINTVTEK